MIKRKRDIDNNKKYQNNILERIEVFERLFKIDKEKNEVICESE